MKLVRSTGGPCREHRRGGFSVPAVVFALVLMTAIAIAALVVAGNEERSSRALRESGAAFFAAESGVNLVYAELPQLSEQISQLAAGDSLVLDWREVEDNFSYRAVLMRTDTGISQPLYRLTVQGRSAGDGRRTLSYALTAGPGNTVTLGGCCDAALTIRGDVTLEDQSSVDGHDHVPDGWEEECPEPEDHRPGIITTDADAISVGDDATISGEPPVVEDPTLDDDTFDQYGDLTWTELKAEANHTIGSPGNQIELDGTDIRPRYNNDGTCDTSHPYNWGSKDPADPCFDYFPVIVIEGGVEVVGMYGQAVIVLEWDEPTTTGGEFDVGTNGEFNGIILGKGCVEIEENAIFHGAIFVDAHFRNEPLCGSDDDYAMNEGAPRSNWSRCVVNRALLGSDLGDDTETEPGDPVLLESRSFAEVLR